MVTITEIEERIAQLHKQGKTSKEISKDVHKNYTFIGAALRKRFPEEYPDTITMTKETQALKAFHAKKSPTEVAIELNLSTDETEKFYMNFWRLERLYELYRIYKEHKPDLRNFLWLYKELKKRGITTVKDFNHILETIVMHKGLDAEIEDFNTNFLPNLVKGKRPSRVFELVDKDQQHNNQTSFQCTHIYTADELERAFYEK